MNKQQFITIIFGLLISFTQLYSQNKNGWEPVYLQVTGANTMDGVDASFRLGKCNNENVVFIKFINHNDYSVKLEWFDAVFTQELKWINKDEERSKKNLLIPAGAEVSGDCSNTVSTVLMINLKSFVADKKEFKRYSSFQLNVLAVQ